MDGAGVGGSLELLTHLGAGRTGDVDRGCEASDPARRRGGHLLGDGGGGAGDVLVEGAGEDAHGGEDAGAEGGGDEVGGGEGLAAALIVFGGIGGELGLGGAVDGFAVEISLIFHLDGDHFVLFLS